MASHPSTAVGEAPHFAAKRVVLYALRRYFDIEPSSPEQLLFVVVVVFLTLTDPLRIQLWSQDRRNQTKSNRESEVSRESRRKRTDKKVAAKEIVPIK